MRVFIFVALATLSACSWFRSKSPVPDPTEFIVTGAPAGSIVFVDGAQTGPANALNGHPQVINVAPGPHTVEIRVEENVIYREETYASAHQHTLVRVLSGSNR